MVQKAGGAADYGWLKTRYSFSFAEYYDPQRIQFGKLRVLNDDLIAGGGGFPMHPHNNMEIITIPQYGGLKHTDSMGYSGVIQSNEVQVMSAGTGIYHSEFNASETEELSLFQIWILTEKTGIKPRYDQKKFDENLFINKLTNVVSPDGAEGTLQIFQQAWISLGNFNTDTHLTYNIKRIGNGVFVFLIEGEAGSGGEKLLSRDAVGIYDTDSVSLDVKAGSRIMVIDVPVN